MSAPKHFLDLDALDAATLRRILDIAKPVKSPRTSRSLVKRSR